MSYVIRTALLLATALTTTRPLTGLAQQLKLSAEVGKAEFFEGEPIYLLVRLRNLGTDTAWVTFFGLGTLPFTMAVTRNNGNPVPVRMPSINFVVPPNWRGDPVPPGASVMNTLVLQDLAGDEWPRGRHLFLLHFPPAEYEVHVEFAAHLGVPRTAPLTLRAAPIIFRIRARTVAEEAEVSELESMWQTDWDTTSVGGHGGAAYKAALIEWVEKRFGEHPDDPFLPFLLDNGMYSLGPTLMRQVEAGKLPRFDPDTSEVVSWLRLGVIERQKSSTGGTRLVQALSARHPDQLAALGTTLGSTLCGQMARYQAQVSRQLQRSRSTQPR
jgi:hypothetical protein